MAFKRFEKGEYGQRQVGTDTVSLNKASISIGKDFKVFFANYTHTELYTDEKERLVGLKPSNNKRVAFPLRWEGNRASISVPLTRRCGIAKGVYVGKVIGDMLILKDVVFNGKKEKVKEVFQEEETSDFEFEE